MSFPYILSYPLAFLRGTLYVFAFRQHIFAPYTLKDYLNLWAEVSEPYL